MSIIVRPAAPAVKPAFTLPADAAALMANPAYLALFADDELEPEPESAAQLWARLRRDYPGYDLDADDDENFGLSDAW